MAISLNRVKTTILVALMSLFVCNGTYAQYNKIRYNKTCNAELVQIDIVDNEAYLFFTYIGNPGDSVMVERDIVVKSPGSYRPYKLQNYYNVTTDKEGGSMVHFENKGQKLNFLLVFNKFPVNKEFQIIEPDTPTNRGLNFTNVSIDTSSHAPLMDIKSFFAAGPMRAEGESVEKGVITKMANSNGLSILATNVCVRDLGKFQRIYLDFKNETGDVLDLKMENVKVTATYENGQTADVPIVKASDIKAKVTGQEVISGIVTVGSTVASVYVISSLFDGVNLTTDTWANNASSTMFAVSNASQLLLEQHPEQYKKVLDANYLKDYSIADNSVHGCLFNIKEDRKIKILTVYLTIGGEEFKFPFTVKHH